ncbi:major facilitator superfamily protein [Kipferlia bialata]|uniref:Major facilitator superfamily protein n=1 Tax=Kipferlia bialata TaxID=797122 RepID=A0A9K3GJN7_9EUKA|nr:major facilitator superfamily protein [Kipferlia bialata]|eukprot:g7085.t1
MAPTKETRIESTTRILEQLQDTEHEWEKKDLFNAIYWLKVVVSAVMGVLFGLLPVTGLMPLVLYAVFMVFAQTRLFEEHLGMLESVVSFLSAYTSQTGGAWDGAVSGVATDCASLLSPSEAGTEAPVYPLMCHLTQTLGGTAPDSVDGADRTDPLTVFAAYVNAQDIDDVPDLPVPASGADRVAYVYHALMGLTERHSALPAIQSVTEVGEGEVGDEELRYVVSALGERGLSMRDINADLVSEPTMWETGAWAVYLGIMVGLIGLIIVFVNLPSRVAEFKDDAAAALTNALAVFNFVQLIASPLWHRFSERFGRKPAMVLISLNYALCFVGFGLSTSYLGVFVFRGLSGLGAIIAPLGNTIIADITPMRQRGRALAYVNLAALIGGFMGPFVNIILSGMGLEWRGLMFSAAAFSLLSALVFVLWLPETAPIRIARRQTASLHLSTEAPTESGFKKTLALMARNKNLVVVFIGYTVTLGAMCLFRDISGVVVRTRCNLDEDVGDTYYSYTILIGTVGGAVASVLVGPLAKRVGERGVIYIGQACSVIALMMMVVDSDKYIEFRYFCLATVFNAASDGFAHPSFIHLCSEWASPEDRGMMLGVFQIGNSLGRSVFSMLQGYLYDANITFSFLFALVWPVSGFICTIMATVPVERHKMDKVDPVCSEDSHDQALLQYQTADSSSPSPTHNKGGVCVEGAGMLGGVPVVTEVPHRGGDLC